MNLSAHNNRLDDVKRLATIVALSALAIVCGCAGCFSMSNIKELDFGITGLEAEFYEPANTSTNKAAGWFK